MVASAIGGEAKLRPVEQWHEELSAAERIKKEYRDIYRWDVFVDQYKGFWNLPTHEIPPLNFVFSWLKTELASLYVRDPHMEVTPLKRTTIEQALLKELALADIWRRKRFKKEVKKAIVDGKLVGHGWFKVGYNGEFETMVDSEGNQLDTIKQDDFFGYRIPWTDVLFDSHRSVDAPFDCQWIAHEFWVPEEEFMAKKEFKHKADVQAQTIRRFTLNRERDRRIKLATPPELGKHTRQKFVQLFEIWDKKDKKVRILSPGVRKGFIHEKDWPYEKLQDFPFSFLNFNPINDEPYGIPDIAMFERQLLELMKLDFLVLDHVKKNNRQLITEPGNLTEESRVAYEEGQTGVLLEANNPDRILPVPYAPVQQDIFALRNFLIQNITNVSGQPAVQRGASQPVSTRTFKELAAIDEGSNDRRSEQLDVLEDFMEDIARKMSLLIDEFADSTFFIKVTGRQSPETTQAIAGRPSAQQPDSQLATRNGQVQGFTATREDFGGDNSDFDIQIKAGSTVPLTRENKTEILRFALEAGPAAGAIPGGPVMGTAARLLFKEFDMPELDMAIDEELEAQQGIRQEQTRLEQQRQEFEAAQKGAEIQIQAEREANRKEETRLRERDVAIREQSMILEAQMRDQELRIKELEALLKGRSQANGRQDG